ncbi:hypothetical protein EEZ25_32125 [Micromonospora aurantiaca]|nr:hypothetical protein EEZ25_32125 [Micromonospora aurantiaca]
MRALVGFSGAEGAGKSSLLNRLTGAGVLVPAGPNGPVKGAASPRSGDASARSSSDKARHPRGTLAMRCLA